MKIYELVVSFLEPARATITLEADSEEQALEMVRQRLDGEVSNLEVQSCKLVLEDNRPNSHNPVTKTLN